jgi:metal-dependent amidase/aminoacylase/carboxypeptidase family protein
MNVRTLAEKYEQYVIDCRHWIHQHPETAWQEWETMEFIENELPAVLRRMHLLGLDPKELIK